MFGVGHFNETHFGESNNTKAMVILRDVSFRNALFGLVILLTPVFVGRGRCGILQIFSGMMN